MGRLTKIKLLRYLHMSFSTRFKRIRVKNGIIQKELAKALNVSSSAVSSYERGESYPTIDTLIIFAKKFNVSVDYLLCLSDVAHPLGGMRTSPYEVTLPPGATKTQYKLIRDIANTILKVDVVPKNE
jgi:transcriptional regulator with XRE-family HTH domain